VVKTTIHDLQFQLEEGIRCFWDCMGLSLSKEEIAKLVSRTEGWISGLHLAALSLQKAGMFLSLSALLAGNTAVYPIIIFTLLTMSTSINVYRGT
jgi:LuxR family maltose regulon positive regulatory protein